MHTDYIQQYLPNGIRLIIVPTKKFKTISIGLFLHQELNPKLAAFNALLPAVLEQGSRRYPDYLTLQREMEKLYGAEFTSDIMKSGEKHVLSLVLEIAHERYIGENVGLFNQGLSILGSLVGDPLLVEGAFKEEYVKQEKNQLIKDIKALLNDKTAYAYERCVSLMCRDERFGVYKLGNQEDYQNIDAVSLYSYYKEIRARNPIDLFIVGDLSEKEAYSAAVDNFSFDRDKQPKALLPTDITLPSRDVQNHQDKMDVNQAKLVMGYRTQIAFDNPLHCALLVYSGILGGFPHSKLFTRVREEANLAYYIHSRLERHKGLMFISAGIDHADFEQARSIIDRQVNELAQGIISDSELHNTKRGLINQLNSRMDSPNQIISFYLDGFIGGRSRSIGEIVRGIEAVDLKDIQSVAERIKLDTVYMLRPRKGES